METKPNAELHKTLEQAEKVLNSGRQQFPRAHGVPKTKFFCVKIKTTRMAGGFDSDTSRPQQAKAHNELTPRIN